MSEQKTSEPTVIAPGPKVKNPAKVAAGKRLGAMSKQAKANKALRLKQEAAAAENSGGYPKYVVGGLIVVGAVSYLLFKNKEEVTRMFSTDKEEPDPVPTPKKEKSKRIFDD